MELFIIGLSFVLLLIILIFMLLLLTKKQHYRQNRYHSRRRRNCPIGCRKVGNNKYGCPRGNFCYKDQCCKYDFDCDKC